MLHVSGCVAHGQGRDSLPTIVNALFVLCGCWIPNRFQTNFRWYLHVAFYFRCGALSQKRGKWANTIFENKICAKHRVSEHIAGYFLGSQWGLLCLRSLATPKTWHVVFGAILLAIEARSNYSKSLKTLDVVVAVAWHGIFPHSNKTPLPRIIL